MAQVTVVKNPVETVFERWSKAIKPVVGKNNYSMGISSEIASAPYARISMLGNPTAGRTLEASEEAVRLTFQCESFADGQMGISDAYNIDSVSHKAMIGMGFQRVYGAELIDNADTKIKRVISRYSMVYTGKFVGQ